MMLRRNSTALSAVKTVKSMASKKSRESDDTKTGSTKPESQKQSKGDKFRGLRNRVDFNQLVDGFMGIE
jgi:hypothetical protein